MSYGRKISHFNDDDACVTYKVGLGGITDIRLGTESGHMAKLTTIITEYEDGRTMVKRGGNTSIYFEATQ